MIFVQNDAVEMKCDRGNAYKRERSKFSDYLKHAKSLVRNRALYFWLFFPKMKLYVFQHFSLFPKNGPKN